jgi:tRNA(Phe) wybutosine-synthesizing methylase Tyw3
MKRYQECNRIHKLWRLRHYIPIPFIWLFHSIFNTLPITDDCSGQVEYAKGKILWKILVGEAQLNMHYYYTSDEVFDELKKIQNNLDRPD